MTRFYEVRIPFPETGHGGFNGGVKVRFDNPVDALQYATKAAAIYFNISESDATLNYLFVPENFQWLWAFNQNGQGGSGETADIYVTQCNTNDDPSIKDDFLQRIKGIYQPK